jgi:tRNA threonylcarbamoyl adenosine modification protein (Sua5/YciO/YrdC/YwlC family)
MRAGALVAFPTETVYGVGVVATDKGAFERLRELKARPAAPFGLHMGRPEDVNRYVAEIPPQARMLMTKAWPGPVTILLPGAGSFPDPQLSDPALYGRICPEGLIGLRCVENSAGAALLTGVALPVVASSANLAGHRPPTSAQDVLAQLDGRIDLLVDAGPTRYNAASTIVSFASGGLRVVRTGVYDERMIHHMATRTILFVCSGNTCRSPMAAGLAEKMLAQREGCRIADLPGRFIQVLSAGTLGLEGVGATEEAMAAAADLGSDIREHLSRKLTSELIQSADVVFCMSRGHLAEVVRMAPSAAGKAFLLDPEGDISDPIGGDAQTYAQVAGRIAECLRVRMKEKWL